MAITFLFPASGGSNPTLSQVLTNGNVGANAQTIVLQNSPFSNVVNALGFVDVTDGNDTEYFYAGVTGPSPFNGNSQLVWFAISHILENLQVSSIFRPPVIAGNLPLRNLQFGMPYEDENNSLNLPVTIPGVNGTFRLVADAASATRGMFSCEYANTLTDWLNGVRLGPITVYTNTGIFIAPGQVIEDVGGAPITGIEVLGYPGGTYFEGSSGGQFILNPATGEVLSAALNPYD